jgi:hypothetical protein
MINMGKYRDGANAYALCVSAAQAMPGMHNPQTLIAKPETLSRKPQSRNPKP